jgi:hypothetical protein
MQFTLQKLQALNDQHKYLVAHIWNLDETCIQVGQWLGIRVPTKRSSQ